MTQSAATSTIQLWVIVWAVAALFLLIRHWHTGGGVGILLTYVVSFGSIHWFPPILYLLPWYDGIGADRVAAGMKLSGLAMVSFAVGAELAFRFMSANRNRGGPSGQVGTEPLVDRVATTFYLFAGLFLYVVVTPLIARTPTLGAIVNTGAAVTVVAIGLRCWNAWQEGNRRSVWL